MNVDDFLRAEVKPALGCTEPAAVALATAHARCALGATVEKIALNLSINIYKNGRSVTLPRTNGLKGIELAAAIGALAGDPQDGLTILKAIGLKDVARAQAFLSAGTVSLRVEQEAPSVWVEVIVEGAGHRALCRIAQQHDRLERLERDGIVLFEVPPASPTDNATYRYEAIRAKALANLWDLAAAISPETEAFLLEGASMNLEIANIGMRDFWGMGVGTAAQSGRSLLAKIRSATGGASDVRMGGGDYPVMSSFGSGNHGITAIVPVAVVGKALGTSNRGLAEALALSHLVCGCLKAHTGRLTPICGCSVAAGTGAAAAITRLMGGTAEQAERAAATLVANLLGMICDGAKDTCSLKVATASCEAYRAASLVIGGGGVHDTQGMVAPGLMELGLMLKAFSSNVLQSADREMAQYMLQHQAAAG